MKVELAASLTGYRQPGYSSASPIPVVASMAHSPVLLHYSPTAEAVPLTVREFAERAGLRLLELESAGAVLDWISRSYPAALIVDGSDLESDALEVCRRVKTDPFTAIVPVVVYLTAGGESAAMASLEAGADEVLTPLLTEREADLRIGLVLRRAERDVSVHPTTRLPGTVQIEREFAERLRTGQQFAVCYADIDNFKEYNDRYGYYQGDRVILITSRILRDVVRGHAPDGFVGHIGGDDFIACVPLEVMAACCTEICEVFDSLIPLQYSEEDRALGSFIGWDRRGNEYRVPLMSLSIGVVTNERRNLSHTAEISALAAEMKVYAKTFPGSLYVVDRRS